MKNVLSPWLPLNKTLSPDQKPSVEIEGWIMVSNKSNSPKKQYAIVSGKFSKFSLKDTLIWVESL